MGGLSFVVTDRWGGVWPNSLSTAKSNPYSVQAVKHWLVATAVVVPATAVSFRGHVAQGILADVILY